MRSSAAVLNRGLMHSLVSGKDGDSKMGECSRFLPFARLMGTTGIPTTNKKFAELELSLLHLQQNIEIPEIHLIRTGISITHLDSILD
jgi:hypothetical protein